MSNHDRLNAIAPQMQEAMQPSMAGQVVIGAAQIQVVNDVQGQRAIVVVPASTGLQIIIPLNEDACRQIGGVLMSKHVVVP